MRVKEPIRLSMEAELFKIREAIEKNHQHTGTQFILVEEAYIELQRGYGKSTIITSKCSSCIRQYNKILCNWFAQMDREGLTPTPEKMKIDAIRGATEDNVLLPIDTRRQELENLSFNELKDLLPEGVYQTLNEGKRPSKKAIINYLLGV